MFDENAVVMSSGALTWTAEGAPGAQQSGPLSEEGLVVEKRWSSSKLLTVMRCMNGLLMMKLDRSLVWAAHVTPAATTR